MCGFVGFTKNLVNQKKVLTQMMDTIIHRGPDSGGQYISDDVALGFRRLSIIDLEGGHQPIYNEDKTIAIVFNGEIYNFGEIREELMAKGHVFTTHADTEVIVHAYEEYGTDFINRLRGMFAFVLWDSVKKQIVGARDYFGIKPFYYANMNGTFMFGSEIKSFIPHPDFVKKVNKKALKPYLTFQYSAMQETFFEGVYKLPPAHFFIYKDGVFQTEKYWQFDFTQTDETFEVYRDRIDEIVNNSVEAHKISDVKIGAFLSGGVDSSYVTACMMPDKTFSVGFNYEKFNEAGMAKELSDILKIENYQKMITADECFDAFSDIQYHMDEPQSNPSSVPLYFLTKLAKEHVTVVLSGEGADEIFGGYEWYQDTPNQRKYQKIPAGIRKVVYAVAKNLPQFKGKDMLQKGAMPVEDYFVGEAFVFSEQQSNEILVDDCKNAPSVRGITQKFYDLAKGKDKITKMQYIDLMLWMPGDILLKADKMSMAHSLELRVPFLDKEVMRVAEQIPTRFRVNDKNTKYVFRKAANKTIPNEWADRTKVGFPVPIRYWLREEKYYNIVKEKFTAEYTKEFFDVTSIMKILDDHYSEKSNNARKIWTIFTFLTWYERFFVI